MAKIVGVDDIKDIELQDYQRRSPYPMINILRGEQLARATGGNSVVNLEVEGVMHKASGLSTYVRNGNRLAEVGAEVLESFIGEEQDSDSDEGTQRVWSHEYKRYYLYDPVSGESIWE